MSEEIRVQDILLSLDGSPINTVAQYAIAFYTKHPGDRVELQMLRGSNRFVISVPVRDRTDDAGDIFDQFDVNTIVKALGIVGTSLNERNHPVGESITSKSGVLVSGKLARTDLDTGLVMGDLIRSVNGADVQTVEGLRLLLQGFKSGDAIVLQVERHGRLKYLPFEID
jgi:serine protease Do